MFWNDERLHNWASRNGVTPYDRTLINPASLDLRLGDFYRLPRRRPGAKIGRSACRWVVPWCDSDVYQGDQ